MLLLLYQLAATTTRFRSTIGASVIHSSNFQLYNSGPLAGALVLIVVRLIATKVAVVLVMVVALVVLANDRKKANDRLRVRNLVLIVPLAPFARLCAIEHKLANLQ